MIFIWIVILNSSSSTITILNSDSLQTMSFPQNFLNHVFNFFFLHTSILARDPQRVNIIIF
jgi:hypothetical protein